MSQVSIPQSVLCFHGPLAPVIEGDGGCGEKHDCKNAGVLKREVLVMKIVISSCVCVCSTVNCTMLQKLANEKTTKVYRRSKLPEPKKYSSISGGGGLCLNTSLIP